MQRETVVYNGFKFNRYPNSKHESNRRYYKGWVVLNGVRKKQYLHRYMWELAHGEIPKGYHVHHVDGNHDNNSLDNLALVLGKQHVTYHGKNRSAETEEKCEKALRDSSDKAAAWHRSAEGSAWHSQNAKKQMERREYKEYTCVNCGKTFTSRAIQGKKFCSNNCKSAWRRLSHVDDEERTCRICGTKFVVNRYALKKCCSASCSAKFRAQTRRLQHLN